MLSLFPNNGGAGGPRGSQALLEFKAGKCILNPRPNGKFQVTADTRRGQISLHKSPDGLLHFKWTNLVSGAVEEDRIIFPGESLFKRVKTGRDNDQVYMLKFHSGGQPLMYWMQDKDSAKYEENVKKANEILNGAVTSAASAPPAAPASSQGGPLGQLDLSSLLRAFSQPLPPQPAAVPAPAATSSNAVANLQRAMEEAQIRTQAQSTPDLRDILSAENVLATGILQDEEARRELTSHLPPSQQNDSFLETTIRSPQLQQSLGSLTQALRNPDNFQSVLSNFQLDPQAGQEHLLRGDGVGAFLASVQSSENASTASRVEGDSSGENNNQEQESAPSAESPNDGNMDQS